MLHFVNIQTQDHVHLFRNKIYQFAPLLGASLKNFTYQKIKGSTCISFQEVGQRTRVINNNGDSYSLTIESNILDWHSQGVG